MVFNFQFPKLCGFYRFEKDYFQKLKAIGVIVVRPSNCGDMLDEEVESVDCQLGGDDELRKALEDNVGDKLKKALEEKVEDKLKKAL